MKNTAIIAHIAASTMLKGPFAMDAAQVGDYPDLAQLGIVLDTRHINQMAAAMDANVLQPTIGAATMAVPVQYLQTWLPGLVRTITAARVIDEIVGMSVGGQWSDEEVIQTVLEPTGSAVPYTDTGNVPLASWNPSYERRTVVRFEQGFSVSRLEEDRAGRMPNLNTAAEKRLSATLALEILRNRIGFYGFMSGDGRTFGYLNDPNLPAYVTVANPGSGTTWAVKTFLQITADIRVAAAALRARSGSTIDPARTNLVLSVASAAVDMLSVTSDFGISVYDWIRKTYPNMRIVPVPELDGANGGANVFYLHAETVDDGSSDGSRVFDQIVPAKLKSLGVEQRAKSYLEDFTNATAGVMLKRPWAVVRYSGI
jgi:hypothetical protein